MEEKQGDQEINEATHLVALKARIYMKIKSVEMPFPKSNGFILYIYIYEESGGKRKKGERKK